MEQRNDGKPGVTPAMDRLLTELDRLSDAVERSNSWGRTFMKGFLSGVGTTVGGLLITLIALFSAYNYLKSVGLSSIFDSIGVDKAISASVNKAMKDMIVKP